MTSEKRQHKKETNRNCRVESYHNWIKNSQDELNSRFETAKERISEFEDITIKIPQSE